MKHGTPIKLKRYVLDNLELIAMGMREIDRAGICYNVQAMTSSDAAKTFKLNPDNPMPERLQLQDHKAEWETMAGAYLQKLINRAVERGYKGLYSGSLAYPVRAPAGTRVPDYSSNTAPGHAFDTLPKWSGEYGKARYQLVACLIAECKRELSQNHRSQRVSLKKKD